MERRSRATLLILSVLLVGCLSFAQAQEDGSLSPDESFSASVLESSSLDITDRNPCSFRGQFLEHKQSITLDPCTECTCKNGTTTCEIESCPSEAGCEPGEIVIIEEECCPQCPYKMYVEDTNNLYAETFEFSEGSSKKIRFDLDIVVDRKLTSRWVRGENLWKLTAWVSPNEDGSGPRFSEQDNIFNEKDAAQEYSKPSYPPWEWSKLRYTMTFTGGSCADYRYFCVQFGQADDPQPTYDLDFTFQAVDNEVERLIDCVPLGECKGLKALDLDWTIEAEDPVFGQTTPVTLDVDVRFDPESANKKGEGLWRVGLFGSANEDGSGARFSEISQTLTEDEASTPKKGIKLPIEGIEADFEIGSIGCIEEASYVCVEFAQGDNPDPPFTMTIEYARQGGAELDSMILCKPQECSARAIFSTLVPDLTGQFPVIENRRNTIQMNLDAITDKDLSTVVPGESLWELGTFFNARPNGKGRRIQEQTQILNPFQQDQDLMLDENLVFNGIDFETDLTGLVCSDVPYICFELKKNEDASLNYVFGTNPTQDPFVECIDFTKYCKGVIYQGIIWDRRIPDHRPGDPVPLTINAAIEVDPVSRGLSGDGLYEMSVFVASDQDGSDRQTPSFDQVLTPGQMSTKLPAGGPLVINGIMTPPLIAEQLGCAEMRYLCVEFRKGPRANPDYTAEFTQSETEIGSADDNVVFKKNSLIQCREENCPEIPKVCHGPSLDLFAT
ncbi:hypothetical protein HOLleu_41489 [Holothuria leucospilota]|uniref:VWFC domain-containing protein n=1 Tax=Holothuria leucospilota TaxID=206669 RepID=A0A9Q0YGJ4_HOLLE|nr:hypothetical protein HOLleu_41489 [Holothuria leucospilota]